MTCVPELESRSTTCFIVDLPHGGKLCWVVGCSEAGKYLLRLIHKAAASDANVLITGETGTGKEVAAQLIHFVGRRRAKSFLVQNCAALPEGLVESELFGFRRGTFTGATYDRKGLLEAANEGTLFLDEVGELPLPFQAKLLRAVELKEVKTLGDVSPRRLDVRIIAATNSDPEEAVKRKTLREDLYYRLNVLPINVPPLRERREDIPRFLDHFAQDLLGEDAGDVLEPAALACLVAYRWPGNIRELKNLLERAAAFRNGDRITLADVAPYLRRSDVAVDESRPRPYQWKRDLEKAEREKLLSAITSAGGNKSRAAKLLGLSRSTVYYNLRKMCRTPKR